MTELLPKPRLDDFPPGLSRLDKYHIALADYYKRLAEFAIERMQSVLDDQLDIENARETLYLTLSTIKGSQS